ncbi:MAG: hypothetical protein RJB08_313 [Actinomycetota bacterium]|jgi:2,4-dienoyl-CoA reductase-like NADH-dependent reductase (Old Yellow Enzyme family)/thioredoxin reductase
MYERLFEQLDIAGTTIPNRVVRSAHSTGAPWVDKGDDFIEYHLARAKGGVGMSILEIAGVMPMTATSIPVYEERVVDHYKKLMDKIRPTGMRVFQQLWHGGSARALPGLTPWSASDVPNPIRQVVPRPMTKTMIDDLVGAFALAARRVKEGGLDGIEIHAAHGYLFGQFLSPATNRRTDDYGGPLENRVRLLSDVLKACRAEVGKEFPIGIRLSSDEQVEGGLHPEDTAKIVALVEPDVDFVDISFSSYYRFYKIISTLDDPLGYELPFSSQVTRLTTRPTLVTGRIMTLEDANRVVESGIADMVSMVRALIADPELVAKARTGRDEEIRPCLGTSQGCVGQLMTTGRLACIVNPSAGKETTTPWETPTPAPKSKKIVVVGGGPAGLESARIAALRGHEVHLFEMRKELGGQVSIAASAPHRSDLAALPRFLAAECSRLGVHVHLGVPVDPDMVHAEQPDEVIIATGSTPRRDGFQTWRPASPIIGHDLPHVYSTWDVFGFGGRAKIGRTAVVIDDGGDFDAISVAEKLIEGGAHVTFVSTGDFMGQKIPFPPQTVYSSRERLVAAGVEFLTNMSAVEVTTSHVEVEALGAVKRHRIPADTVVLSGMNHPNRELFDALEGATFGLHLIGDAVGGKSILEAVSQATQLVRSI